MFRTTILLPEELKMKAEEKARRLGMSLGEFIRKSLLASIGREDSSWKKDPFFSDQAVYTGKAPTDLAKHHDDYLYGSRP